MMKALALQPLEEEENSAAASSHDDLTSLIKQLRARDSSPRRTSVSVRLCDPDASRDVSVDWAGIAAALGSASGTNNGGGLPSPIRAVHIDLSNASAEASRSWQASMLPAIATLKDSLESVTLRHCNVTPTTCGNLLNALDSSRLTTLVLANNPLGPRGAKVLAAFLRDASALQVLNAASCSLGHFGAQALGGSLPSTLVRLDVSHNSMGHDGIWKFADAGLTNKLAGLVELNVSNNQIGDDGCLEIANRLMWLPKLEVLNLSHSDIGSVGMEGLAHSLMDLETASAPHSNSAGLPSCYDSFDSHDGISLAAAATPGRIRDLCLSNNRLDNASAQHLGAALTKLGGLRRLNLSHNSIGDDGAQSLVDGLLVIPDRDLQVLDLSHNQISDLGAGAFVEHLESLRNLQSLVLSGNDISDARTRIVEMLLKHRQSSSSRAATRTKSQTAGASNGAARRDDVASVAAAALGNEVDDVDSTSGEGSRSDDGDLDEEQLALGRDRLSELLMSHHEDESATTSLDRTQLLLLHQRNQLHLSYLKFLTNNFDRHRVLNAGVFGVLYAARDDHHTDGDGEEDDDEQALTLTLRELGVGSVGPLKVVRDAVLEELVCERRNLQLAGFIPALAVTASPSAIYVLYDTTRRLSLRQILSDPLRRKSLTLQTRVRILTQAAHALRCLHTGEVEPGRRVLNPSFHGDVQPSNIYVSVGDISGDDDDVKVELTDALVSRLVATDRTRFKLGDAVFGSRSYRCPRYERGSAHYDASSDVFSFGVVMAELLSGRLQRSPLVAADSSTDRGHAAKGQGGLQFYDVYYDVVISRKPFAFDPLRDERSSAAKLKNPPTDRYLQMLVQVLASCMGASVSQRPTAATLARILEHENPAD
jgi:serine/threonine protein kinase/Leucine-rich repeat (LRR) protein